MKKGLNPFLSHGILPGNNGTVTTSYPNLPSHGGGTKNCVLPEYVPFSGRTLLVLETVPTSSMTETTGSDPIALMKMIARYA